MIERQKEGEVQRTWLLVGRRGTVIIPRIISVQPREENAPLTHSLGSKQRKAAAAERRNADWQTAFLKGRIRDGLDSYFRNRCSATLTRKRLDLIPCDGGSDILSRANCHRGWTLA